MVYVISGQGIHKLSRAGEKETLSCGILYGDIFLLRPGDVHTFICCSNLKIHNILFMPSVIDDSAGELRTLPGLQAIYGKIDAPSLKLHFDADAKIAFEFQAQKLATELSLKKPGYRLAAKAELLELLVMLGRLAPIPLEKDGSSCDSEGLFRAHLVNKAICLMEANLAKGISIDELASKLRMSPSHLTRTFKELSGLPPCEYMIRLRLEKSKAMLLVTDLPIANIAFLNGFCDASYMTKLFKKLEGCTPNEFRRMSAKQKARYS